MWLQAHSQETWCGRRLCPCKDCPRVLPKDDDLGDPLINDDHALALELATEAQIETIKKYAHQVNDL